LAKNGYAATIFEALPVAGGMLAVGIPEYRLPKEALQRDLDYLKALGVAIKTDCALGREFSLDDLKKQGYEAIFIAIGAHKGKRLPMPGADLEGVLVGASFLRDVRLGKKPKLGNIVLVIGAGYVAFDCARTALRSGVSEVHIAFRKDRQGIRADAVEIDEAEEEGAILHPSLSFTRIIEEGGRVSGVACSAVRELSFDQQGAPRYDVVGSEQVIKADTVIFAVGQSPELDAMPGIETGPTGAIAIDPDTLAANLPGVFAGGDAVGGPGSAVEAIASGRRAARSIQRCLEGRPLRATKIGLQVDPSAVSVAIPPETQKQPRQTVPKLPVSQRKTFEEVSLGLSEEAAVAEAKRCLNCAGHLCKTVCPYKAPQFGEGPDPKMEHCNFCLDRWAENKKPICVAACPMRALDAGDMETLRMTYGDCRETEGFAYSPSTGPSIVFKGKKYKPPQSRSI
jgi:NADH-quinone oxidoreductase subunit F